MIFRTGCILVVGLCDEEVLQQVYVFIKNLLVMEFPSIYQSLVTEETSKVKNKKSTVRKRYIIVDIKV